jgi:glycosyltransferase involved in cell wall biosynthesis
MRVLTVVNDLGPGGTQRAAQNFTLGYRMHGHEAAVLAVRAGGPRADFLGGQDVQILLGGPTQCAVAEATRQAAGWRPDVVHVHRPGRRDRVTAAIIDNVTSSQAVRPAVLETNVFGKVDYSGDRRAITVHMPLTRWSLWKWRQWTAGLRPTPVGVVMPNLIETSAFTPVDGATRLHRRRTYGIPEDAFVFGRIGQPIGAKWSPVIFDAFASIARDWPEAYLLLVGLPSELRKHVDALPRSLQRRIVEAPFMLEDEELRSCYGAMDVFLHASAIGESFGFVLAEAMLCERPVITLSTPLRDNSQLEVVGHGRGGLVVNDVNGMMEAMRRLLNDDDLRERLGRDGRESIRQRYDLMPGMRRLLKIAELARQTSNSAELTSAFAAEPDLTTFVATAEISAMLEDSIGPVSQRDRYFMKVVHTGLLYRVYSRSVFLLGKT